MWRRKTIPLSVTRVSDVRTAKEARGVDATNLVNHQHGGRGLSRMPAGL